MLPEECICPPTIGPGPCDVGFLGGNDVKTLDGELQFIDSPGEFVLLRTTFPDNHPCQVRGLNKQPNGSHVTESAGWGEFIGDVGMEVYMKRQTSEQIKEEGNEIRGDTK